MPHHSICLTDSSHTDKQTVPNMSSPFADFNLQALLASARSVDYAAVGRMVVPYEPLLTRPGESALLLFHVLSFGLLFGVLVWQTFIAGIALFKALPKREFGTVQSTLFPHYFRLSTLALECIIAAVYLEQHGIESAKASTARFFVESTPSGATLLQLVRELTAPLLVLSVHNVQLALLVSGWFASVTQQFVLGPWTTRLLAARQKATDELAKAPNSTKHAATLKKANSRFGMVHGFSSLFNLHILLVSIAHALYLATVVLQFAHAASPRVPAPAAATATGIKTA